jgi:hypothetical protein
MKTILGLATVSWLMFVACGGDSSAGSPSAPEQTPGGAGGEHSSGETTPAGAGGESTSPLEPQAGSGGDGGAPPANLAGAAGAAEGGSGGEASSGSPLIGHIQTMSGVPLAGAIVIVGDETTLTDETGTFALDDVAPSYDLAVIHQTNQLVEIVDGLTTREPTVRLWQDSLVAGNALVSGKLSGGAGFPLPKNHGGLVAIVGDHAEYREHTLSEGNSTYSFADLRWEGGSEAAAEVVGLEWTDGPTGPTSYDGAVRQPVVLTKNAMLTATNLAFTKPQQKTVTGTWTVKGAPDLDSWLKLGPTLVPLALGPGAFSVVVPDLGVTPVLEVSTTTSDGTISALLTPATALAPLALETPPGPKLIVPVDDAKGVSLDTEFKLEIPAQTFALSAWLVGSWFVIHVTRQTSLKLPDLRSVGITYEGDDPATWLLQTYGPADTPEGALTLIDGTSPALTHSVTSWGQAVRTFYLAP